MALMEGRERGERKEEKERLRDGQEVYRGRKDANHTDFNFEREIGHPSASPEVLKAMVSQKHAILGLGLPTAMCLPRMGGGSTASSLNLNAVSSPRQTNPGAPSSAVAVNSNVPSATSVSQSNRLSVVNINTGRLASIASPNGSSLRPVSVASSNYRLSGHSLGGQGYHALAIIRLAGDEDVCAGKSRGYQEKQAYTACLPIGPTHN